MNSKLDEHNIKKLSELRPPFKNKVEKILDQLKGQGYQPKITCAYRSAEKQLEKFNKGFSKTSKPGYHNWGLAVDIIDRRWGWVYTDDCAKFFHALRQACDDEGVANGGWWKQTNGWKNYNLGFDPAHCQYIGTTKEMKQEYKGQG